LPPGWMGTRATNFRTANAAIGSGMFETQVTAQGWIRWTPEGRCLQIRGWRAGGSLAVASSTPATPLVSCEDPGVEPCLIPCGPSLSLSRFEPCRVGKALSCAPMSCTDGPKSLEKSEKRGVLIPIRNSVPLLIRKTAPLEVVVGGRAGWAHMRTPLGTRLFLRGVDGARECGEAVSPRSALGRGRGR